MTLEFDDKPSQFPTKQTGGAPLKPITQVLLERRATSHFKPDPVPDEYLGAVLRFAAQAPSGYNLQPWKFIVVRDAEARKRLQTAAFNQAKIFEAPVVVIAFGIKKEWKENMDAIFLEGVRRGYGKPENLDNFKNDASGFLDTLSAEAWVNRHVMIAFAAMMLVAEAYGLDTAPMEGFDPDAVKSEFGLPENSTVVALLAIGFMTGSDKPYGGRLALKEFVFEDRYGNPWRT